MTKKIIFAGLVMICIMTNGLLAQQNVVLRPDSTKVYISRTMEDLKIINDTALVTSIQLSSPYVVYNIKNDTLIIKEQYTWYGPNNSTGNTVKYHNYKILNHNEDTIVLKNTYHGDKDDKPENWEDPLIFVNLERIKQPVNDFRYLKLNSRNSLITWIALTIDSVGKLNYEKNPVDPSGKFNRQTKMFRYLSTAEFNTFKNLLSKSFLTSLPAKRGCGDDAPPWNFEVVMNSQEFITEGCTLYYPQKLLLNYLFTLVEKRKFKNMVNKF